MDDNRQKVDKKVIKIITVAAIALIVLLTISLVINLVKLGNSLSKESRLKDEIAAMDKNIDQSENVLDELKSFDYVEQYARDHLNMKGRDEQAFVPKAN